MNLKRRALSLASFLSMGFLAPPGTRMARRQAHDAMLQGLRLPPGYAVHDPYQIIIQKYEGGAKVRHISKSVGLSRQRVIDILKMEGVWHGTKN